MTVRLLPSPDQAAHLRYVARCSHWVYRWARQQEFVARRRGRTADALALLSHLPEHLPADLPPVEDVEPVYFAAILDAKDMLTRGVSRAEAMRCCTKQHSIFSTLDVYVVGDTIDMPLVGPVHHAADWIGYHPRVVVHQVAGIWTYTAAQPQSPEPHIQPLCRCPKGSDEGLPEFPSPVWSALT